MPHWLSFRNVLSALLISIVLLGLGVCAGIAIMHEAEKQYSLVNRLMYKLNLEYNSFFSPNIRVREEIVTNRVELLKESIFLPPMVANHAGGITTVNGDSVLILDRLGKIFHFKDGVTTPVNIETPSQNAMALSRQLESGLLGDISIQFNWFRFNDILFVSEAGNREILVSYTEWHERDTCFTSTLAKLEVPSSDPAAWSSISDDWEIVARTSPCLKVMKSGAGIRGLEAGGRLAYEGEGNVIWTSGAYERDDQVQSANIAKTLAQDDKSDYGKVLRVNIHSGDRTIIAKGLRNPQGVTIGENGDIWVTDHGMRGGDELNLVLEGANFGWPAVTLGTKYNRLPGGGKSYHDGHWGYNKPAVAFVPSIAPTSVLHLRNFAAPWKGDILVGGLNGNIYRVYFEEKTVLFVEEIPLNVRVRDIDKLDEGKVVIWGDDRRLVFLTPKNEPNSFERFEKILAKAVKPSLLHNVKAVFDSCIQCHSFSKTENMSGPSLSGICGRRPGSGEFGGYSGALNSIGGRWTRDKLASYISDPKSLAPGTSMAWAGVSNKDVSTSLAEALCDFSR